MTKVTTKSDILFKIGLMNDLVSDLKEYHAMYLLGTSGRVKMSLYELKKKTLDNIYANLEQIDRDKAEKFHLSSSIRLIVKVIKEYE